MDVSFGPGELTVIGGLLGAVVSALVFIFRLLLAAQAASLADAKLERDNYKSVAGDAVRIMNTAMEKERDASGTPPVKQLAAVLPEHQSPVSAKELTVADLATLRARVEAAALEMNVPGRADPPDRKPDNGNGGGTEGKANPPVTPGSADDLVSKIEAVEAVLKLPSSPSPPGE